MAQIGETELDVRALARALWRRSWLLVLLAIIAAVGTYVGLGFVDPLYTADTSILIEERESPLTRPRDDAGAPSSDFDELAIQSQVEVLRSREIAEAVIDKLDLTRRPEFDPARQPSLLRSLLVMLGLGENPAEATIRQRVMDTYFERLSVYPLQKSRVIGVEFSAPDPDARGRGRQCRRRCFRRAAAGRQARIGRRGDRLARAGDRAPARARGGGGAGGRRLSRAGKGSSTSIGAARIRAAPMRQSLHPAARRPQRRAGARPRRARRSRGAGGARGQAARRGRLARCVRGGAELAADPAAARAAGGAARADRRAFDDAASDASAHPRAGRAARQSRRTDPPGGGEGAGLAEDRRARRRGARGVAASRA